MSFKFTQCDHKAPCPSPLYISETMSCGIAETGLQLLTLLLRILGAVVRGLHLLPQETGGNRVDTFFFTGLGFESFWNTVNTLWSRLIPVSSKIYLSLGVEIFTRALTTVPKVLTYVACNMVHPQFVFLPCHSYSVEGSEFFLGHKGCSVCRVNR